MPEAEKTVSALDKASRNLIEYGEHLAGLTVPIRRILELFPDLHQVIQKAFSDYNFRFTTVNKTTLKEYMSCVNS